MCRRILTCKRVPIGELTVLATVMAILANARHNEPPLLNLTGLVIERSPNRPGRSREFVTRMITGTERAFAHSRNVDVAVCVLAHTPRREDRRAAAYSQSTNNFRVSRTIGPLHVQIRFDLPGILLVSGHESRKADAQSARFGSKSFVVLARERVIDQDEMISKVVRRARSQSFRRSSLHGAGCSMALAASRGRDVVG